MAQTPFFGYIFDVSLRVDDTRFQLMEADAAVEKYESA
jgi:hypothetical protein